jgi:hypothetical protein
MPRKSQRRRLKIGLDRWNKFIDPYVVAARERGFIAELTRFLNKKPYNLGVMQQQVTQWMRNDPERRIQPGAGVALVLLDALPKFKFPVSQ